MFEEAISVLSIWASMNSWLTPTVLFLLLNLMIGTIAVTSAFSSSPTKPPPLSLHHSHHQPQLQPQLSRSSSVLQRLKSLNLYSYTHSPQPLTVPIHHPHQPPPPPPADLIPVPVPEPHPHPPAEDAVVDDDGPTLEEVYSRIVKKQSTPHYGRQNSDTEPAGGEIPVRLPAKIKKSASDNSAFNHFEAVSETEPIELPPPPPVNAAPAAVPGGGDGHEVDARADDFINRFRNQLKMQRLDSIVRYKDMITRGSAE